jgi:hypothetical protein
MTYNTIHFSNINAYKTDKDANTWLAANTSITIVSTSVTSAYAPGEGLWVTLFIVYTTS